MRTDGHIIEMSRNFLALLDAPNQGSLMLDITRTLRGNKNKSSGERKSPFVVERCNSWKLGLPHSMSCPDAGDLPAVLAVGGGKGGVGKSIISANLSAILSQAGYRVLVIDLDLGCANLHTQFGIPMPRKTLADFLLRGGSQQGFF